jgi:hypothetical protein
LAEFSLRPTFAYQLVKIPADAATLGIELSRQLLLRLVVASMANFRHGRNDDLRGSRVTIRLNRDTVHAGRRAARKRRFDLAFERHAAASDHPQMFSVTIGSRALMA